MGVAVPILLLANGITGDGRRIPESDTLAIPAHEWAFVSSKPSLTINGLGGDPFIRTFELLHAPVFPFKYHILITWSLSLIL